MKSHRKIYSSSHFLHLLKIDFFSRYKSQIFLINFTITGIISSMTVFAEANVDVDLRMLRSFRVLRPLKLVSRIPSKRQCVNSIKVDSIMLKILVDTYQSTASSIKFSIILHLFIPPLESFTD